MIENTEENEEPNYERQPLKQKEVPYENRTSEAKHSRTIPNTRLKARKAKLKEAKSVTKTMN